MIRFLLNAKIKVHFHIVDTFSISLFLIFYLDLCNILYCIWIFINITALHSQTNQFLLPLFQVDQAFSLCVFCTSLLVCWSCRQQKSLKEKLSVFWQRIIEECHLLGKPWIYWLKYLLFNTQVLDWSFCNFCKLRTISSS